MKISNIFTRLKKMPFQMLITLILWLVTMIWLIVLVVLFVLWASIVKQSTPVGTWEYGYTNNLKKYMNDRNFTQEINSKIVHDLSQIDVTKSVKDGQEPIPNVKTLGDLLKYEDANLRYDINGAKAPEKNTMVIDGKKLSTWELKKWPTSPTAKAEMVQNIEASMSLIFVVILAGTIFSTVLFAVKKNTKKGGNNG